MENSVVIITVNFITFNSVHLKKFIFDGVVFGTLNDFSQKNKIGFFPYYYLSYAEEPDYKEYFITVLLIINEEKDILDKISFQTLCNELKNYLKVLLTSKKINVGIVNSLFVKHELSNY